MKSKFVPLILLILCFAFGCKMFSGFMEQSGSILTIKVESDAPNLEQTTEETVKVLESRLDALDVSGEVTKISADRIDVKIYKTENPERIKSLLISASRLELRKVDCPPNPAPVRTFSTKEAALQSLGGEIPSNRKILLYKNDGEKWIVVYEPPIVDGRDVRDASAFSRSKNDSDYQISFSLNPQGAQKFGAWTAANINTYLAVVLNDEVKSVAFIKSQIFDSGEISGNFTKQEAEDMALTLKSGYLPATLVLVEEKTFGK